MVNHIVPLDVKGLCDTLQSGKYTISYLRGRYDTSEEDVGIKYNNTP